MKSVHLAIERLCIGRRSRRCNRGAIFVGKISKGQNFAVTALQPLVFRMRQQYEARDTMVGDGDRLLQGLAAKTSESLGNFT
jgi:hypothetical protein